ncbi:MAG TPA: sialate O-acetylesterase, partial [Cytophagales bacterium]|nr:sialate O-acetylesterase [Cytophagales bacterium]
MKRTSIGLFLTLITCFGINMLSAAIGMKIPFSSHMVLQRNAKVNVWGTGAAGEIVTLKFNGQTKTTTTGADNNWKLQLDPMTAAGPLTMTVSGSNTITFNDIYIGEVWQCGGQSNMDLTLSAPDWGGDFDAEIANANYPRLRYMKTRRGNGTWNVMSPSTAAGCSATGYFFGKDLMQNLDCAVGLMVTAVGGTTIDQWFDPISINSFRGKLDASVNPGDMYEQFVKPVIPYTIKGMVWIQGEQNASRGFGAADYGDRFKAVISNYRKAWGQGDFPFYFGQITGVNTTQAEPHPSSTAAMVREGQRQALELPQTAISVMLDISGGGWHYRNKREAGRRLALAPKALLYGKPMEYSGPLFESCSVEDRDVTIRFIHATGLKTNDAKAPAGIALAGADGVWYFADKIMIQGTSVVVSSTRVPKPLRVCMGWNDRPRLNLYNSDGLQASPFVAEVNPAKPMDCMGVQGGTAIRDLCGRCVGGSTGKAACNLLTEAEDACAFDGVEETSNAGFKGISYVNVPNETGASI